MNIEELKIYKQYVELIYYTETILVKFPKSERFAISTQIKNATYDGLRKIIECYKAYDKKEKIRALNQLDVNLKMLKVMIRVSKRKKYISINNYTAWSKKITNITNLMAGWINACVKQ